MGVFRQIVKWFRKKERYSLIDGRIFGKFYVRYPDGQMSINMDYETAKDYSEIFGGTVYYAGDEEKRNA